MLWSSTACRVGFAALAFAAAATLSGCSGLTPVYSDQGAASAMAVRFDDPNNPLEQIVYQDLGHRFNLSDDPNASEIGISVSSYTRQLTNSQTTDPAGTTYLSTVSGVLHISRGGSPVTTATRQATATYKTAGQVLGDNSAQQVATEQAAHALADTLQLTIISALSPKAPAQ